VVGQRFENRRNRFAQSLKANTLKETAQLPTKVMVIGVADFAIDHPGDADNIPGLYLCFPGK